MKSKVTVSFMLMGILFSICLVLSNILAVKQFQIFGFPSTAGLIIFPISYVINDCITEVWGFRKARLIIWTAFAVNFLAILLFQISIILPPASHWMMQDSYASVLAQTPRIALASLLAFLVGSFLNAYVMSRMKIMHKGKKFGQRAIASTVVGELADTLVFTTVGFLFVIPLNVVFQIIMVETVAKIMFEILVLPITRRVVNYVKRVEGTDVYDEDISYSVIKIKDI
ncbi:queuosine precursor transporter [uncultured Bacteroides sp.]|uniref:queuosine precursor transporter n=1 Tax=uncultured Bacteroides sp. TaxID=162156 RepID=UPI002AAAA014|nr:queuosine precursor transporter [uncultured Bacteroides sp.]